MTAAKFHVGFVGPCRDGVPGTVVAIVPDAQEFQRLVYLRGERIFTALSDGQRYSTHETDQDLLPPAPKMVTRWMVVESESGYSLKAAAETEAAMRSGKFTVVPVEVPAP